MLSWLAAMIAAIAGAAALGEQFTGDFELPDTDSRAASELLEERFPTRSGDPVQVVLEADSSLRSAELRERVSGLFVELRELGQVAAAFGPYGEGGSIAPGDRIGLGNVLLEGRSFQPREADVDAIVATIEEAEGQGLRIELGGETIRDTQRAEPGGLAEVVGVVAAIFILLITFGSVVAMGLPIITAIVALGTALSLVTILTNLVDTADFAPALAAMIGLGVGIDYALFVVTRYRAALRRGIGVEDAVLLAMDTAGRAVLFAGATVCVALLGLFVVGVEFLHGPALAASLAVLLTMFASLTLLPAMLSKVGERIDRLRLPGFSGTSGEEGSGWARWSRMIQRRPWPAALASGGLLLVLTIPVLSLDLGNADAGTDPAGTTTRAAYDLLAEGFGPGFNGPLLVVVELGDGADPAALDGLSAEIAATEGVAGVTPPQLSPAADAALITVLADSAPQDQATTELVERLREGPLENLEQERGLVANLGGETAIFDDFTVFLNGKLPMFFGVVILLSALLLMAAFRSILVPVKAVVMNLLSIGAAFGIVVAIFQFGWGNELIGLETTAPIQSFLPVFVFAIVFGLSMDYEVFLMSRVHEEWERTGDASESVARGLASTGRVITAAAAIMMAVFSSFAFGDDFVIKLFGVSLAAAVFLDAFVIRSLLVPAVMELLGPRAWWLPRWLDRLLPTLNIEAEPKHEPVVAPENLPARERV